MNIPPNLNHIRRPSNSLPESLVPSMEQTMLGQEILAACEEKFPETAMKDFLNTDQKEQFFKTGNLCESQKIREQFEQESICRYQQSSDGTSLPAHSRHMTKGSKESLLYILEEEAVNETADFNPITCR